MHLTGIPLETLVRVGALAGLVVVIFYILKLRRRPIAVPFSHLWQKTLQDKDATSFFSQLKRWLSLLLQLALLALLLLALGDPRSAVNLVQARNVVVLVDASASMKATDVAPSRVELVKKKVTEIARGLSGSDRMIIVQMDGATTPLSTLTSDIPELTAAIASITPTDSAADFARALRYGIDTLAGLPSPEIIVASDGALGEPADGQGAIDLGPIALSYIPVGESARNAAITGFSVRRYPLDKSRYEVMLEVTNTSPEPMDVELSLYGDDKLTDLQRLKLQGNERLSRFYPNLSGASKTLEARLALPNGGHDDLSADDHAYALLPERRRARIQVVSAGNMYLDAALLLDEYLDVTTVTPEQYPADGKFDVTIFDKVAPKVAPSSGSLFYLDATGDGLPFEVVKAIENNDPNYSLGFDEVDAKSPLVRYTALGDINIARAHILKGNKDDKVVGASFKGPLLLQGSRDGVKFVALGFDPRESDFPMRISWPLFVLNTINDFVEEDTGYIASFTTGSVFSIPAPAAERVATILQPGGASATVPIKDGRARILGQLAGFYTMSTPGASSMFAANLSDPAESAIEPRKKLVVSGREAGAVSGFQIGVRSELWIYLLAAVLILTSIEWLTYHRRLTV